MSDTPEDAEPAEQEGGYGFPTLEQEVTPEVLNAGRRQQRAQEEQTP